MNRRDFWGGLTFVLALAGCSGNWSIDYEQVVDKRVTSGWHLHGVKVLVPDHLTQTEANTYAPNADIVWHGEPKGNRRAQVAAILKDGILRGSAGLNGTRGVRFEVTLVRFHAVTPAAVSRAPGAVHNIQYIVQVFDDQTGRAISDPQVIDADLEAYVGDAAIVAAIQGQTQRVRIVDHIARVTKGWLGQGPDPRGKFSGVGR